MTEIHDSNTCQLGPDNGLCEMCAFASKSVVKEPSHSTMESLDFDHEWANAPRSATEFCERETANYWFLIGARAERERMLTTENQDLKEMTQIAQTRQ